MFPPTPRAPLGACSYLAFRLTRTGSGRRDQPGEALPRYARYPRQAGVEYERAEDAWQHESGSRTQRCRCRK